MWIELHQTVWRHRKTLTLAALLGIRPTYAAAHVAHLWCWALDNALIDYETSTGHLTDVHAAVIAAGADWDGDDPAAFVTALLDAKFLVNDGGRLVIHDWWDYAGKLLQRRQSDAKRKRDDRLKASAGHPTDIHRISVPTVPNLTVPNLTVPSKSPSSGVEAKANGHAASDDAGHAPSLDEMVAIEPEPIAEVAPWPDMAWIRTAHDEAWWPAYPRKTHKADSLKAFTARMKRHRTYEAAYADLEQMLEAVVEQSQHWTDPAYTPHSATYIRGERDADEIIVPTGRRERGRSPAEPWPS
jgi:hypothetical protein